MIRAGSYDVGVAEAERFRLDGGAMFGVVPRTLWEKSHPPDEKNRIRMVTRCLVARGEGRLVLVDTGMGGEWSDKERAIYAIENGHRSILSSLEAQGIAPEDVTDVVLTHLHFDHAGGTMIRREGRLEPAFPKARYHVQQTQLDWAMHPTEKDRRSFRPENFLPLREEGRLTTARGSREVAPGICVEPTQGHTVGHQIVRIGEGEGSVVYCGDLIPTAAHVPTPWVMAYDLAPLTTMDEKRSLLGKAADQGWILVMEHDPGFQAVRVGREKDGFTPAGGVALGPLAG
ncbi:MAG TPA: MBL fold metallo-hydrolase [Candidatus Polarisedimenticolia bacterium]|nr:MBL fold metallo-hydrolase [Candidatus Polarisedimenticolia bacterium]